MAKNSLQWLLSFKVYIKSFEKKKKKKRGNGEILLNFFNQLKASTKTDIQLSKLEGISYTSIDDYLL